MCRILFRGERADVSGDTVHTQGFKLRMGRPGTTIAVAAFGPRLLRLAAEQADRVVLAHVSIGQIRAVRTLIDTVAHESGRPAPHLVVWTQTGYGAPALNQIRRGLVSYLGARGYGDMFVAEGFASIVQAARSGTPVASLIDAIPPELAQLVGAVGEPDEVGRALRARYEAGADTVVVTPATETEGGVHRLLDDLAVLGTSAR